MPVEAASSQALPHQQDQLSSMSHARTRACWAVTQAAAWRPAGRTRAWAPGQCPCTGFCWPALFDRGTLYVRALLFRKLGSLPRELGQPMVWTGLFFLFPTTWQWVWMCWVERKWQRCKGRPKTFSSACGRTNTARAAAACAAWVSFPSEGLGFLA